MVSEEKKNLLKRFAEGRELYIKREFQKALTVFEDVLKMDPNDGPGGVYFARCKLYIDNPPPEDWDGVFIMNTK